MRYLLSDLEVRGVQRQTETRPAICRAAKIARARLVQSKVPATHIFAFSETHRLGICLIPAALENDHPPIAVAEELSGDAQPGSAGADDAYIRVEDLTIAEVSGVVNQGADRWQSLRAAE